MTNDSIDNLRLDLNKGKVKGIIYVRLGDTRARTIHVTLANNGSVVSLDGVLVAEMLILKPDGAENDQTVVVSGNELQYTFRTQDLNVAGECTCQIMLTYSDGTVVTSPEFSVMVYEKVVSQELEKSQNEYSTLSSMVVDCTAAKTSAATSATSAAASALSATTSEENASASATSAQESATTAENASLSAGNSATASATSASEASSSATAAQTSATEAATSATSAAASAEEAKKSMSFPLTASIPSTLTDSSSESIKALDVVGYSEQTIPNSFDKTTVVSGARMSSNDGGTYGDSTDFVTSDASAMYTSALIPMGENVVCTRYAKAENYYYRVGFYNSSKVRIGHIEAKTFTTPSNTAYIAINGYLTELDDTTVYGSICPTNPISIVDADGEITSTSSDGTSNSIILPYTLRSIGDVHDEIIVNEDGSGSYIQRIESITVSAFSGGYLDTSNNQWLGNYTLSKNAKFESQDTVANALCTKLPIKSAAKLFSESGNSFCILNATTIRVTLDGVTTLADLNSAMGTDTVFNYELETPITTPLTSAQVSAILALQTYKTTSVIECEVSGSLTYQGDVKTCAEDNYSYTEQKIGKWADGKDLYRIVIKATTPSTADATTDIASLPSTVSVKRIDGCFYLENGSAVPLGFYGSSTNRTFIYCSTTMVKMNVTSNYLNLDCEIIVEYTK